MINPIVIIVWIAVLFFPFWCLVWWYVFWKGYQIQKDQHPKKSFTLKRYPVITILLPMYDEKFETIESILNAMNRFEYDKSKLDVKIIVESSDPKTLGFAKSARKKTKFPCEIIINTQGRSKPHALNYCLDKIRGEIVTIFDADDQPESDQLKKVVHHLENHPKVVCVQAKLNFYNHDQNLLTKFFTIEFSSWYDIFLPGWQEVGLVYPLCGTSSYIRTETLKSLGGWDPNNVTEDIELGIRLAREGHKVEMVDSTTWEEAVPYVSPWLKQRSRWNRGYIQCLFKHGRNPIKLYRDLGLLKTLSIYLLGISPLVCAFSLILWAIFFTYFLSLTGLPFIGPIGLIIRDAFSTNPFLLYVSLYSLIIGNIVWLIVHFAGVIGRKQWHLLRYVNLLLLYALLMGIAAWKAIYQIIVNHNDWTKTPHGLNKSG